MNGEEQNKDISGTANGQKITTFIFVLILVLVGVFFIAKTESFPFFQDAVKEDPGEQVENKISLNVVREYRAGIHTYEGKITLPTPCHTIEADALVLESFPEQVTIRITTSEGEGICAQVLTPKPFTISFQASEEAKVSATVNGEPATLIVVDGLPDDNVEILQLQE